MVNRISNTITLTAKNRIDGLPISIGVFETKLLRCEICDGFIWRIIGPRRFRDVCSKACDRIGRGA